MMPNSADTLLGSPEWLDSEQWAWEQIRAGRTADFTVRCGVVEPSSAEGWTSARELRPQFIEALLDAEPYRSALPNQGLHVVGAWVRGPLSLGRRRLQRACRIERSRLEASASLRSARSLDDVSFEQSVFCSALDMADVRVDGTVDLSGAVICGDIDLSRAQIVDHLKLEHAQFNGKLTLERTRIGGQFYGRQIGSSGVCAMDGIRVGGSLSMASGACDQVSMKHASIAGHVDLSHLKCSHLLDIEGSDVGSDLFLSDAVLNGLALIGAKVRGQLTLSRVRCEGGCDLEGVDVHADIFLRHSTLKTLDLTGAATGGQLVIEATSCDGPASMQGVRIGTDLIVESEARLASFDLVGATIGGDLRVTETSFSGGLDFTGIAVAAGLQIVESVTEIGLTLNRARCRMLNLSGSRLRNIELRFAQVEELINLTRTTVECVLDMEMVAVGGNLFLRDNAKFGRVYLWDAKVRGTIEARAAVFEGCLDMNGVTAGSILLQSDARFNAGVNLTNARVDQNLELAGAHFRGLVDLTGAELGSALVVSSGRNSATWDSDAQLILQNVSADAVQVGIPDGTASVDPWPMHLRLHGLTYRRMAKCETDSSSGSEPDADGLRRWLARDQAPSQQPYQQLASVLAIRGDLDESERILFAGHERKRKAARGIRRVGYEAMKWTIGYGIGMRYFWSLPWVFALTIIGGIVFAPVVHAHWAAPGAEWLFSFDQLLPIVHVTPAAEELAKQVTGWPGWYLAFHRMCGFVLGSFIVAGLTGVTRK